MKRLSLIILTLLGIICQSRAQIYFNIYQNEVVLNRIPAYEVDSITVTETSPHLVRLWYDGNVIVSYDSEEIDSINVSNDDDPLSYMGIVGFNDELYKKEIDVLATSTAGQFRSFVSSLPRKDGTLLYYAVDNAIDMLGNSGISTPLSCINLITFTDGLDQGSIMMNTRYSSSKEYLNAMSKLIRNSEYNGLPINAYSVGLRGTDVSDITSFRNNLSLLASSADKSFEVNSIYDLRTKFQEIANQIISVSIRQTISLKIPGIDSGTRVRFVFDGQTAENSDLYIEGTFNLSDLTLRNVTYHGMRSRSGNIVQGTQDGIFVTFTFLGLQREDASQAIPTHIRHYYMLPSSSTWQQNSEFSPENNTQRTISHSGTIVVLVLDCSNSLGNDFNKVKQYANDFIDMIAQNTQPFSLKAPENAKAELDGENFTIVVSWDPVKYAEYYRVYRSSSNYNVYNLIADNVTLTSWTDKTPFSGNNYYWIEAIGHGLGIVGDCTNVVEYKLGTPENAKVVWNDNDDVVVSWDAVKYAEGYQVYRSYSSGGTYSLVAENVTSISWIDKAPLAGNNYYRIKAVGHGLTSGYSNTTNVLQYALDAPMNAKAELDDANFYIVVSWDAVKHAEGYQVYRNGNLVAENIPSPIWIDKAPLAGYNYYRIKAVGHGLTSGNSNTTNTVDYKLDAPGNAKVVWNDNDDVVVSWDAVKYAERYQVYRSSSSNGTYSLVAENVTSISWTDKTPLAGNNYYRIKAVGHGLTSGYSNTTNVLKYALDAPMNAKAELDDANFYIVVSWDAVKHAEGYQVYRNGNLVAENIPSPIWIDKAPLAGNNYYRIKAVGHGLTSGNSNTTNTVDYKLDAPGNAKVVWNDNDDVVVSWDAVKHAEGYQVYRSSSSNGTYSLVAENVTSISWIDKAPLAGNNYYRIKAVGHGLTSGYSNTTNVLKYALDAPMNAKAELDDANFYIVVSWGAVKHAEGYQVYRCGSSGGTYSLIAENVTSISWTDKTPLAGNNYYRIKAVGHGLTSGYSNTTNVLKYALDAPINAKAELDDANLYIVVSWDAVKHAEGYQVYRCGSSGGTYSLVAENVTSISWTDKTPLSGRNYYQIEAVGHGIKSEKTTPCLCVVFTNSYVDLSLPSGTLWATMNVGASKPEDYGDFFAWGETEPKSDYNGNNYFDASYSKYNKSSNTELLPEDDVAYVKWGYDWCMPSKNQLAELINSSYTTKEWTTYNGVKGHWITSKTNWNSIFLPAGGIIRGSSREKEGSYGYYWSRTIDINYSGYAWHLYNYSNGLYVRDNNDTNFGRRMYGLNVRPVRSKE